MPDIILLSPSGQLTQKYYNIQMSSNMEVEPLQRKFIKPSSISQYLKCPICMDVFRDALRLFCGHTFCNKCLHDCMKNGNVCPQCRSPIDKKNIGVDLLAREIINQLQVFCVAEECPWKGILQDLEKHVQRQCIFMNGQDSNYAKPLKKNQKIVWHETLDDEVMEKINENTVKGSLQTRILIKTDSLKQCISNSIKLTNLSNTQPKSKKAGQKGHKKQKKNNQIQQQMQQIDKVKQKQKSSNYDFLSSLFQ